MGSAEPCVRLCVCVGCGACAPPAKGPFTGCVRKRDDVAGVGRGLQSGICRECALRATLAASEGIDASAMRAAIAAYEAADPLAQAGDAADRCTCGHPKDWHPNEGTHVTRTWTCLGDDCLCTAYEEVKS